MHLSIVLVKIAGVLLFLWTLYSFIRHLRRAKPADEPSQSRSEKALNSTIYYLWIAFMTAFSLGMVFNN